MKYFVISDIHGSVSAVDFVPQAFESSGADAILCLGDVLYHGPRNDLPSDYAPKQVIEILNPLSDRIIAVKGNCDTEVDQMVLNFPLLATYTSFMLGSHRLFCTHGHTYSPDNLPALRENDVFLSGHTHIPTAEKKNGICLLNPGSAALPKQGHPRTYGILTDNDFTVYTLDHKPYMHIDF